MDFKKGDKFYSKNNGIKLEIKEIDNIFYHIQYIDNLNKKNMKLLFFKKSFIKIVNDDRYYFNRI